MGTKQGFGRPPMAIGRSDLMCDRVLVGCDEMGHEERSHHPALSFCATCYISFQAKKNSIYAR